MTQEATVGRRPPGRPRQTPEDAERVRGLIVEAAETVFAEHGRGGLTAARLLQTAGLSRTNMYRYFRSTDEALEVVLDRFTSALIEMIETAVTGMPYGQARVVAGVEAFLAWSLRFRHLLPSVMADQHDPASPVSATRRKTLDAMIEVLTRDYQDSDRPTAPDRTTLDIFVNGLEYTAFRMIQDGDGSPAAVEQARWTMLKLAAALLGQPHTWRDFARILERRG